MKIDKISFWKWAYSDFLSNTNRSVLGEFIVHEALQLWDDKRVEWDNVDLRYSGLKIEVKTSAYIQSWSQNKPSRIVFDIAPRKRAWDSILNTTSESKWREADIYIFCLLNIQDKEFATETELLDMRNWSFYIVKTDILNSEFSDQKSISLAKLETISKKITFPINSGMRDIPTIRLIKPCPAPSAGCAFPV